MSVDSTTDSFADNDKIPKIDEDSSLFYPDGTVNIDYLDKLTSANLYADMYYMGESHIWADAWNWAVGAGIIEGYPDNTLRPAAELTRAEYAEILERFVDYVT